MSDDPGVALTLTPGEQKFLRTKTRLSDEAYRSLEDALRASLPSTAFVPQAPTFTNAPAGGASATEGIIPRLAISPSTPAQLAVVLRIANEHDAAVIPWGSGRHMALGNMPSRYDIAIQVVALTTIIEYEPADMTVSVEAGVTMGTLRSLLAHHNQFLPIDAPDQSTVGGVLASGVSGPSRHAYGLPRDWLIGCKIALADGSIVKGGGRVVKNVAGYDIPKLVVGSLGTLGVIVEATFKVAPIPPVQETMLVTAPSLERAFELLRSVDERGLALRAVAVLQDRDDETTVAFWLAGPMKAVERTRRELSQEASGAQVVSLDGEACTAWWTSVEPLPRDQRLGLGPPNVLLRVNTPSSEMLSMMNTVQAAGPSRVIAYPTTGMLISEFEDATIEESVELIGRLRERALACGGSLVVTSAPSDVKRHVDTWGNDVPALAVMRNLKALFDPKLTLNPGRFVGGI